MTDLRTDSPDLREFEHEFAAPMALTSEDADLLFRTAHTAHAFADTPVGEAVLRTVYDLVKWAPTAFNGQPLRVVAVRSAQARERLAAHMGGGNAEKTRQAPLALVLAADLDFHEELPRVLPAFPAARDLFADPATRQESATLNAALQAGYLLLALRGAGLAVGPMTGFDAAATAREFFPDSRHQALMVVNVGYPSDAGHRPRQPRLAYEDVVTSV